MARFSGWEKSEAFERLVAAANLLKRAKVATATHTEGGKTTKTVFTTAQRKALLVEAEIELRVAEKKFAEKSNVLKATGDTKTMAQVQKLIFDLENIIRELNIAIKSPKTAGNAISIAANKLIQDILTIRKSLPKLA